MTRSGPTMLKTMLLGVGLVAAATVPALAQKGLDEPFQNSFKEALAGKTVAYVPVAMNFDLTVDLPLYTEEEVSREHLRLRRDPAKGQFLIVDNSRNGTWLDGRRLSRGVEVVLPDRAEIGVAEVLKLMFEVKRWTRSVSSPSSTMR